MLIMHSKQLKVDIVAQFRWSILSVFKKFENSILHT